MMDAASKKHTGSFYTCNAVADYIAKWAIESPEARVLEPSFGDGIFIDSAISRFLELVNSQPAIIGVEMQAEPFDSYIKNHAAVLGYQMDFMDYRATAPINAIIGNPPYVRLKNLASDEREKALRLVRSYGVVMQTSGSLWMPFIIHSTEMLSEGGKLGFVLPYEITHVRYAFELWKYLSENFGQITICRIFRDFFPDVDVETIVLLAEKKGKSTDSVDYKVFDTISDLYNGKMNHVSKVPIDEIVSLQKPFARELVSGSIGGILDGLRKSGKLAKLVDDCKFKIGYVSGNKGFFHPSENMIRQYGIKEINLKKCLVNAKQINANANIGIETGSIAGFSRLFYPVEIGTGEQSYIEQGERRKVNEGYKCRVRNPWYLTPGLEIPDVILTVFGDVPKLLLNDARFYVSNSLLSGFSRGASGKELICRWYNSLTLLLIEITIHSLGGGTLVLIPGETDKLELLSDFPDDKVESTYKKIAGFAKGNTAEETYRYGDRIVLKEIYGFSEETIREIRSALLLLRNWRNPDKRRG